MRLRSCGSMMPVAALLLATSACAEHAVPSSVGANPALQLPSVLAGDSRPPDTTSILKKLRKDVVIGSTVDAKNGDKGPRALSIVGRTKGVLTQGQLLVCNFEDSAGVPGNGTTIEVLNPKPGSQPVRFFQGDSIKGCDGDAYTRGHFVFGSGRTSGEIAEMNDNGVPVLTFGGKNLAKPLSDTDALPEQSFSPEYIYAGTTAGGIASLSIGFYGNGKVLQVADGFAATKYKGLDELGPSGLQYNRNIDTLYIVDGVTNTLVAFSNASKLLAKDEIIVKPGGKTFKCKYPKVTCASLVYSGSPLDAPMASTLLPNGNLVVANTQGTANTLVELTPQGQVLDTKVVDKSPTQGVFGLAARGKNDSDTVIFFTDTNSNTVNALVR
ncbi:MAG: hypothetical protein JO078_05675 [Candidatus Eremiobacteraeota bacterium]|nr:hypothetical protein [Candidatus Eremiobacteraeota bacterium]